MREGRDKGWGGKGGRKEREGRGGKGGKGEREEREGREGKEGGRRGKGGEGRRGGEGGEGYILRFLQVCLTNFIELHHKLTIRNMRRKPYQCLQGSQRSSITRTVKPVKQPRLDQKKWSLNRGGLLIEVKMHGKATIGTQPSGP